MARSALWVTLCCLCVVPAAAQNQSTVDTNLVKDRMKFLSNFGARNRIPPKGTISPWRSNWLFQLADLYAVKGRQDSAFYCLFEALRSCPDSLERCADVYDADVLGGVVFRKWYRTEDWKKFEAAIRTGFFCINEHLSNPQLAFDLLVAKGNDQGVRWYAPFYSDRLQEEFKEVDSINLVFIKKVIAKYGFPTIPMVGKSASEAAFLLCQHADGDLKFQKKVLVLMQAKAEEVSKSDIAYLTDRIMVAEEGRQLFGTQFKSFSHRTLFPVKDSAQVDQRRKAMGLSPLSEYVKAFITSPD